MKTISLASLALFAALSAMAPVLAQNAATPQVIDHKTIAIAEAFPDLAAGKDRVLHARKIELAPGARTALFDRKGRPAITYVTKGEVVEHREGAAPIQHGLHAATMDKGSTRHYWENVSAAPAELLVVELSTDAAR
jgi:quercetin dioxygenase-like cupin family protein